MQTQIIVKTPIGKMAFRSGTMQDLLLYTPHFSGRGIR
jgi:hypothetical protein